MATRKNVNALVEDLDLSEGVENRRQPTQVHGTSSRSKLAGMSKKTEQKNSHDFIVVDPDDCYISPLNRRQQNLLKKDDYQDKIEDFSDQTIGQIEAIVVRDNSKQGKRWEVIAGSLRHAAGLWVKHNTSIKFKLKAHIRSCNDIEATRISNKENTSLEMSAYENAFGTKKEVDTLFDGIVAEYCRVMGEKETTVNELLAFTQIPHECLDAFESVKSIRISHATAIRASIKKNKNSAEYIKAIISVSKKLANREKKGDAKQTLKYILSAGVKSSKIKPKKHDIKIGNDKKGIQVVTTATGITTLRLNKVCRKNSVEAKKAILKHIDELF